MRARARGVLSVYYRSMCLHANGAINHHQEGKGVAMKLISAHNIINFLFTMIQDHIQVNDVELDVVCSNFGNRILLILTQLQKIGTMVVNFN